MKALPSIVKKILVRKDTIPKDSPPRNEEKRHVLLSVRFICLNADSFSRSRSSTGRLREKQTNGHVSKQKDVSLPELSKWVRSKGQPDQTFEVRVQAGAAVPVSVLRAAQQKDLRHLLAYPPETRGSPRVRH